MAVGSRRSWEAAFGDKTIDETTSVIGRGRGQSTLDVQGVSTSSRKTAVHNEGEQLSPDAPCARRTLPRGSESSHITPAHPALVCPSRHRR